MSATLIQFPQQPPPNEGNGALEVVRDYLERVHAARVMARVFVDAFEELDALPNGDHFLAWLWEQGFKVVQVEGEDLGN